LLNLPDSSEINIYNVNGQLIKNIFSENDTEQINVSSFEKGIYLVQIKSKNAFVSKKMIIQ